MKEKEIVWERVKVWRLGKDGFEETTAKIGKKTIGTELVYDPKFQLEDKNYHSQCNVCLIQLQGYACQEMIDRPGAYEEEGGCKACKYMCGKPPVHIGVRNYCSEHMPIMNLKLGVRRNNGN